MLTILIETLVWEYLLTLSFRLCETEKLSKGFYFKGLFVQPKTITKLWQTQKLFFMALIAIITVH